MTTFETVGVLLIHPLTRMVLTPCGTGQYHLCQEMDQDEDLSQSALVDPSPSRRWY
jgi:hypothetical protein